MLTSSIRRIGLSTSGAVLYVFCCLFLRVNAITLPSHEQEALQGLYNALFSTGGNASCDTRGVTCRYSNGCPYFSDYTRFPECESLTDEENYFQNCWIHACHGDRIQATTCSGQGECTGDTLFELYFGNGTKEVASNDDSCGLCSNLEWNVSIPGCDYYILKPDCYGGTVYCGGRISVTVSNSTDHDISDDFYSHDDDDNDVCNGLNDDVYGNDDDARRGHVIEIDWSYSRLSGSIPVSIGAFADLMTLKLEFNDISGTIPDIIGQLSQLDFLSLYNNQLSGTIPDIIGSLVLLNILWLDENKLSGTIPSSFENLMNLEQLWLSYNDLSGVLPEFLGTLHELTQVQLNRNYFSSTIPDAIGNLSKVKSLSLGNNELFGSIPLSLGRLPSLEDLDLRQNNLTGVIPAFTEGRLVTLLLGYNKLDGVIPSDLSSSNPSLQVLSLQSNQLTGPLPLFNDSGKLEKLYLSSNHLSGPIELSGLGENLTILHLSDNLFSGTFPNSIVSCVNLEKISIGSPGMHGTIPNFLGDLTKLTYVFIAQSLFNGTIPVEIGNLENVTLLDLHSNQLSGRIPLEIGSMINMEDFDVSGNKLDSSSFPDEIFSKWTKLRSLYLGNNTAMSGEIHASWCVHTSLDFISIYDTDMCYPDCLTVFVRTEDLPQSKRCIGSQDVSFCALANATNLRERIKTTVDYHTFVEESSHPYTASDAIHTPKRIFVENAEGYNIKQFSRTNLAPSESSSNNKGGVYTGDYLLLCSDDGDECEQNGDGVHEITSFENRTIDIEGDTFFMKFHAGYETAEKCPDDYGPRVCELRFPEVKFWGYQLTITATIPRTGWECNEESSANYSAVATGTKASTATLGLQKVASRATDLCSWTGVTCNFGLVTQVDLSSMGITGSIPAEFFSIESLVSLTLSSNDFSGELPDDIGSSLPNLEYFDLSNNNFRGKLPSSLFKMKSLRTLIVSNNQLSGSLPTEIESPLLSYVYLDRNKFSNRVPEALCNLPETVKVLTFANNELACYESCWEEKKNSTNIDIDFGGIELCSDPTPRPTPHPTSSAPRDDAEMYAYSSIALFLMMLAFCYFIGTRTKSAAIAASFESEEDIARKDALERLPVHKAISEGKTSTKDILELIEEEKYSLNMVDFDNRTAFQVAVSVRAEDEVILALVIADLAFLDLDQDVKKVSDATALMEERSDIDIPATHLASTAIKVAADGDGDDGAGGDDIPVGTSTKIVESDDNVFGENGEANEKVEMVNVAAAIDSENVNADDTKILVESVGAIVDPQDRTSTSDHQGTPPSAVDDESNNGTASLLPSSPSSKRGGRSFLFPLSSSSSRRSECRSGSPSSAERAPPKITLTSRPSTRMFIDTRAQDRGSGEAWTLLVQNDRFLPVVRKVVGKFRRCSLQLANVTDNEGRTALELATLHNKLTLRHSLYFFKTYEALTGSIFCKTGTSIIFHGKEHGEVVPHLSSSSNGTDESFHNSESRGHSNNHLDGNDSGTVTPRSRRGSMMAKKARNVFLKLLSSRAEFLAEINSRRDGRLDSKFVLEILSTFDGDETPEVATELKERGFEGYKYCIVMPAGDRSLEDIIRQGEVDFNDWAQIRVVFDQITSAVDQMHRQGLIHGVLKPKNIIRMGHQVKLMNLGGSQEIESGFAGSMWSSGYLPPEMIHHDAETGRYCVKSYNANDDHETVTRKYDLQPAQSTHDSWALGAILYELCTGVSLFHSNNDDNIGSQDDFKDLFEFSDAFKSKKLRAVESKHVRNLVSQLLTKNPKKRLTAMRAMHHPLLTGNHTVGAGGASNDGPEFDVFLSYRVSSDTDHVSKLYQLLTAHGLRVWWDRKSLKPGVPWEIGFCDGLLKSKVFMPVLSRDAINHATKPNQNFANLVSNSPCDNVLLEHLLALNLQEIGRLDYIFPVMIGDRIKTAKGAGSTYSHYFQSGCPPKFEAAAEHVVVQSIENKLCQHLDRQGQGTPVITGLSPKAILGRVFEYQGFFVQGKAETAFNGIEIKIKEMVNDHEQTAENKRKSQKIKRV